MVDNRPSVWRLSDTRHEAALVSRAEHRTRKWPLVPVVPLLLSRPRVQSLVLPNFLLPWGCLFWFPESVTPSDRRASQNLWLSSIFRINEEFPIAQSVMRAMHCAAAYCLDQIWQAENFRSTRRRLFLEISSAHGRASLYSAGFLSVCNYCLF